ncbi:putative ABC-type nitrate transport system, periplasmic component [Thiomonas sp. X19]|uniref:ABC transporter substrate-binding protein n=1 Tax=Thiomonas sp. X19 TaxID=1050370 RepID=UPI000B6BA5CC|nr:ABC transporter substrate-binding protein [Thiomonas sp. X19]SCC91148.1 putative ABC-type nitrate transport system, periplasmic component [Thiomonas sp. X19]
MTLLQTLLRKVLPAAGLLTLALHPIPSFAQVTLGVSDWPGWVAWYVAEKEGYFKKYGADVKLVWFPDYMTSVNALSAGQIDANCQALIDTLSPVEKKVPAKVILVTDNSAGNDALMVRNSIKTFPELKGKTVGVEIGSIENYLAATALKMHGMGEKDVNFVNMSTGDAAAALIAGKVPAAGVWNPWIERIQQHKAGHPLFTSKSAPGLIPDVVYARDAALAAHRKDFVGMTKAWFAAVKFIEANPMKAAEIMAPHVGLKPQEYALSLAGTKLFGAKLNLEAMGKSTAPVSLYVSTAATGDFLVSQKAITATPDPAGFIDAGIVKAAMKP